MKKAFVCQKSDIPPNSMKEYSPEGWGRVLVLESNGTYFACQAECPHQQVSLCEGFYDGSILTCHQHLWQWDVRTGVPVGLAEAPLQLYEVVVEEDFIYMAEVTTT